VSSFVDNLMIFGRLLRRLGLEVYVGRLLDVTVALQHVDLASREDVHFTCRALLVHRHEDLAIFDAAFDAFWQTHDPHGPRHRLADLAAGSASDELAEPPARKTNHSSRASTQSSADRTADASGAGVVRTWSDADVIARMDEVLRVLTPADIAQSIVVVERERLRRRRLPII